MIVLHSQFSLYNVPTELQKIRLVSFKTSDNLNPVHESSFQKIQAESLGPTAVSGKSPVSFSKVRFSFLILIQLLPLNTTAVRLFLQKVSVRCVYYYKPHHFFRKVNIWVPLNFNEQDKKSDRRHACVSHFFNIYLIEMILWKLQNESCFFPLSLWKGTSICSQEVAFLGNS